MHEDVDRETHAKLSSDRTFGLVITAAFAFFALKPLVGHRPMRTWCIIASGLFFLAALLTPSLLHPLHLAWIRLGELIGKVTNPIVTGLMFFLLFAPVAMWLRFFGRDLLRLKPDPGANSYWIPRSPPGPGSSCRGYASH